MKACASNIANVRARDEQMEAAATQALKRARANEKLDEEFVEYKDYPEWVTWDQEQQRKLHRQRVLVVTGPSRMGKSEYLKAQLQKVLPKEFGTLIVNCMNVLDPDLKAFKCLQHGAILFDEGSPDMVQRHRDLFQAPQHEITLGTSATSCYAYQVCLWRVRLLLTCNGWFEKLEKLEAADKEWVEANTIVISVDTPMWKGGTVPRREQSAPTATAASAESDLASDQPPNLAAAGA